MIKIHAGLFASLMLAIVVLVAPVHASEAEYSVGVRHVRMIDQSRTIKTSGDFKGTPDRRLDVTVWYPTDKETKKPLENAPTANGGPWPLIIYSHGTYGSADNAKHFVTDLVRHGYIVAAPDYPLTSRAAFTSLKAPDVSDVANQTQDISFVIDKMLADSTFGSAIDGKRIGTTGHSLGGVTSYFASFGLQTRDPRISATAPIGAGDPVQSALMTEMGLAGTGHAAVSVPVMFLSGELDVFARTTGRPYAAYSRLEAPKYEVMIEDGVHVWFRDGDERPKDGRNPDCLFFDTWMPDITMPGCEGPVDLIDPARQKAITRAALLSFFDAYLKDDTTALTRLRNLDDEFEEAKLRYQDDTSVKDDLSVKMEAQTAN